MNRFAVFACAAAALAVGSSSASAQLVFGTHSTTAGAGAAYYLDLTTNTPTRLWNSTANYRVNGMATDEANHRLFINDSARLSTWNYGSVGTLPTFISSNGAMFRYNPATNTSTGTGVDGLEFVNGQLYGWTNFGSTVFPDGIYSIQTAGATPGLMIPVWTTPDSTYDFEGFAFNPADGYFYGTNASTIPALGITPGIYKVDALNDPNAVPIRVSGYDASLGLTAYDGMAIGGGSIWLTQFVNGTASDNSDDLLVISKYNLATGLYDDSIGMNIPSGGQVASGATWAPGALIAVPEPTTLTLGAMGLALLGVRRRGR